MVGRGFPQGVVGRFQVVPADPGLGFSRPVLAAGAVLWRWAAGADAAMGVDNAAADGGGRVFACVHRPGYDDWSLAKGKVDAGESLPVTAVREVSEETGFVVRLGKLVGHVTYPLPDKMSGGKGPRTKVVYYWVAEVVGGEFVPNDEVDEVRWLSADAARELLSYDTDRLVLAKAVKRLTATPVTSRVLLVRHAKAARPEGVPDEKRPLTAKGVRQAKALASMLAPYGPTAVFAAEPDRCVSTAAPLADAVGVPVVTDSRLGDASWCAQLVASQARVSEIIGLGGTSVIVSQGLMIPEVVAWLSARGTLPIDSPVAKKASVWVLSFTDGALTGADYLESPLAVL